MDLVGKGTGNKGIVWVARRIPDGYICAHANQARITTFPQNDPENCLFSEDVISFAREKGLYEGEDKDFKFREFHFARAVAADLTGKFIGLVPVKFRGFRQFFQIVAADIQTEIFA